MLKLENAIGTKDGVNTSFSTSTDYVPGSLKLFFNGVFDHDLVTETGVKTFTVPTECAPLADEDLCVTYRPI